MQIFLELRYEWIFSEIVALVQKQVRNDYTCGHSAQVHIVELNYTDLTNPRPAESGHYSKIY